MTISIEEMAERARLSRRTFVRRQHTTEVDGHAGRTYTSRRAGNRDDRVARRVDVLAGGTSSPDGNATRMMAIGASSRRSMTAFVNWVVPIMTASIAEFSMPL